MKSCRPLVQELLSHYRKNGQRKPLPKVSLSCCEEGTGEGYTLSYAAGEIHVKAQSPLAAAYALSFLNIVGPAGHWREFLGAVAPRFPLRAIRLARLPLDEDSWHIACRRLIQLGYNALMVEEEVNPQILKGYGLQLIQQIAGDKKCAYTVDNLFYTSTLQNTRHGKTVAEQCIEEMRKLESAISQGTRLIYHVPYERCPPGQAAALIQTLALEAGQGTSLAFPVSSGQPIDDHAPLHPFMDKLREMSSIRGTGLIPLLNSGSVAQGGGLWPSINMDQAALLGRLSTRHFVRGCIGWAENLPQSNGFLEAGLWLHGQILWHSQPPVHFVETWWKSHRPEPWEPDTSVLLEKIRELTLSLSRLRVRSREEAHREECRFLAEKMVFDLKLLEIKARELEKRKMVGGNAAPFTDYLCYFIRDLKRLVKTCQPGLNIEVDTQESIWTCPEAVGRGDREDKLLERPQPGTATPKIARILLEN